MMNFKVLLILYHKNSTPGGDIFFTIHTKHHKMQYKNQIPGVDVYKTAYMTMKK
jgi:hypothetical protein